MAYYPTSVNRQSNEDLLNDARLKLNDPNLTPENRAALEQQINRLQNNLSSPDITQNPISTPETTTWSGIPEQNAAPAQQYTQGFVGEDTQKTIDPDYVTRNDFDSSESTPAQSSSGGLQDGIWESLDYARDWNDHHGKFKFLFKVYLGGPWQFYVKSATKPKVKMVHTDANYYNFRTKIFTQTLFDPITIVLNDEIGNSVNKFFATYLATVSGQGSGNWGIDSSFDTSGKSSSSSKSYRNKGYGDPILATVVIEQVYANGSHSNRFIFKNARIESMDLDELAMDASNDLSTLSITFNYDALECKTVERSVVHTDPNSSQDLLRGGGSAGPAYGANDDGRQFNPMSIGGYKSPQVKDLGPIDYQSEQIFDSVNPTNIFGSLSFGPNGITAGLNAFGPNGSGGITIGPNGARGGFNVPGFGANLVVGPNGIAGGIAGGVPGVGGQLVFGPNGVQGQLAGGVPGLNGGIAFNPNGIYGTISASMSSQINTISPISPPQNSTIPESQYVSKLSCSADQGYINNLLVSPLNG
jgi:hypothetical protein